MKKEGFFIKYDENIIVDDIAENMVKDISDEKVKKEILEIAKNFKDSGVNLDIISKSTDYQLKKLKSCSILWYSNSVIYF